jgi:hypothetical protein
MLRSEVVGVHLLMALTPLHLVLTMRILMYQILRIGYVELEVLVQQGV